MLVEAAFKRHSSTGHRGLQTRNGAVVALAGAGLDCLLAMVLDQGLQLVAAHIKCSGEVQCDVGRVVVMRLAEFVRPVIEQLPSVGALFRNLNRISVHVYSANW